MKKTNLKKEILRNEDFLAKAIKIPGIEIDDIMAEFNAFDWMDLREQPDKVFEDFKTRLNFNEKDTIYQKAFAHKFTKAVQHLSALVEEVHAAYNIPQGKGGAVNQHINKYYYLKLWADKKCLPVDYNEKDYNKRRLFNFYTILFDIFADKLTNYNAYNAQKQK